METFKVIFKDNDTEGVYAISVVENPAMESQFITLAKQEQIQLKSIDEEKRILLGAVLIPDKPIYRNQDGKEFNIVFPKETIRLSMENFFKKGYQNNSTLEHNEQMALKDVTFVESWIKEDETNDKSVLYGFDEPVGTWFASMKINNDEVWNEYVKSGKVKGFSIDGFFDLEKVNLKSEINMSEVKQESLLDTFKTALSHFFNPKDEKQEVKVELGEMMTSDGSATIEFEGEMLSVGAQVFVTAPDTEEKIPLPDGEYPLESGMILVAEGGMVKELKEPEQAPAEQPTNDVPAQMEEAPSASVKSEKFTQEVFYQLAEVIGKEIEKVRTELKAEFEAKLAEVKPESVSLTKQKPAQATEQPKTTKERLAKAINEIKN